MENFSAVWLKRKTKKAATFRLLQIFGRGDRVRVSGGHLCAKHRSTDRGGSRDLEPATSILLVRKIKEQQPFGYCKFMVEATGLEPAASCSQSKRATKLRHASLCNCVCLICRGTKVALVALLRFPKFLCALERHRNFDRCAISPSLYLPPAAVRLNAQSKRATKLRHASILSCVVLINFQ